MLHGGSDWNYFFLDEPADGVEDQFALVTGRFCFHLVYLEESDASFGGSGITQNCVQLAVCIEALERRWEEAVTSKRGSSTAHAGHSSLESGRMEREKPARSAQNDGRGKPRLPPGEIKVWREGRSRVIEFTLSTDEMTF
jgi:hypothetical protein